MRIDPAKIRLSLLLSALLDLLLLLSFENTLDIFRYFLKAEAFHAPVFPLRFIAPDKVRVKSPDRLVVHRAGYKEFIMEQTNVLH